MSGTADDECPLSELPASQCACPRHRGGTAPGDEPIETEGRPFLARYPGRCARCDHGIHEGDAIDPVVDGGGYVHVRCPR